MMPQPAPGGAMPIPQAPPQYQQQPSAAQYQQQPSAAQYQHQHQQWMAMMQQQQQAQPVPPPAGWTPQPVPPPASGQMQQYPSSQGSGEIKSLWIGDLQPHMDENYLLSIFSQTGEVVSAKVIKNKQTGHPEGYGFIEFATRVGAESVLQNYNGSVMPNSEQSFRMNWATFGPGEKRQDDGPEYTIFVGDLAADVTDYTLQDTFKGAYTSVKGAKVVTDRATGRSKGYGFVKFADEGEQMRAMTEMNGVYCGSRPMRIGPAANKRSIGGELYPSATNHSHNASGNQGENDPNNTTIFVGGLDPNVTDEGLRQVFGQFGDLHSVKIPTGKRCGFVQFVSRSSAEQALQALNGSTIGGANVRLSWGRSPASKQVQTDQTQWNGGGGYYGYPQGYEGYGYPPQAQDPNMYYGGYGGYNYQQAGAAYQQQPQQ